jgi:acid phosphatase type 7
MKFKIRSIPTVLLLAVLAVAPGSGRAQSVVAVAGDFACNSTSSLKDATHCQYQATSDLLTDTALFPRLDRVVTTGDHQYTDGKLTKFRNIYHPTWGRFLSITKPVPGCHDYWDITGDGVGDPQGYYDYFNGEGVECGKAGCRSLGYYTWTIGSYWRVFALNVQFAPGERAANTSKWNAELTWLRNQLAANTRPCVLAHFHKSLFSSGIDGNSTHVKPLWDALYQYNADLVVSSHDHDYERFAPQKPDGTLDNTRGIREFLVGSGGASLFGFSTIRANSQKRLKEFGVLKLTLNSNGYTYQFINVNKTVRDSGSGVCH